MAIEHNESFIRNAIHSPENIKVISEDNAQFIIESRIEGILLRLIQNESCFNQNTSLIKKIKESKIKRVLKTAVHLTHTNKLCLALDSHNVPYALLKGSFLLDCVYKDLSDRPINDIDLLISEHDIKKVTEIAEMIGFNHSQNDHLATNKFHEKPMLHKDKICRLEIHTKIFEDQSYSLLDEKELNCFQSSKKYFLCNELNLLHLIFHGTSKGCFDVGMQFLFDIQHLISNCDIKWKKFKNYVHRFNLEKEVLITKLLLQDILRYESFIDFQFPNPKENVLSSAKTIIFTKPSELKKIRHLFTNTQKTLYEAFNLNQKLTVGIFIRRLKFLISKYFFSFLNIIFFKKGRREVISTRILDNYFNGT